MRPAALSHLATDIADFCNKIDQEQTSPYFLLYGKLPVPAGAALGERTF